MNILQTNHKNKPYQDIFQYMKRAIILSNCELEFPAPS